MKKEKVLEIVRGKATADLLPEEVKMFTAIGEALELEEVERNAAIQKLASKVGVFEEGESAADILRKVSQKVESMEQNVNRGFSENTKYNLKKMLEDRRDEIVAARKGGNGWAIEFKAKRGAAALMTTASVLSGAQAINNTNVFDDMEVAVIAYPANFIIDAIGGRQVSKVPQTWSWKEQTTESTNTVAAVSEGAEKTLADKLFVWKYATRKKYAGRIEFTEELTYDMEQLFIMIIEMFEQQVVRAWNAGVQTDLLAWAPSYTSSALDGYFASPGISQVIQAGKLWVSDNNFEADMVMLNPADAAKAMIMQNSNGDISYVPEAVAFHGLRPFISNNVPAGTIVVGTSNIVKEQHSAFILRRGVTGTQFYENEETIVGEVFSNLKLPTITKNAWCKLDTATVLAALTEEEA